MKLKEESEKASLKLNIQKTKIMASGPITSWQTEEGKVETVTDFMFLGSKITADGDYSHKIKRHLLNTGNIRDQDLIPGSGRSPREGNGNPLQYSCLENPHGQWRLGDLQSIGSQRGRHHSSDLIHTMS